MLKDIGRQTRRQYPAEEKIRIVLEGLRGDEDISELYCRGQAHDKASSVSSVHILSLVRSIVRADLKRWSRPDRVWNRIPDDVQAQILDLASGAPELSQRELAVRFTDERKYFAIKASVYRLLKAYYLITSPAYVVIETGNEFKDKTTAQPALAGLR